MSVSYSGLQQEIITPTEILNRYLSIKRLVTFALRLYLFLFTDFA